VGFVLENLTRSDRLAFISESESAELRYSFELFNRDWISSSNSHLAGGKRFYKLRRVLSLHKATSVVLDLTRHDVLDHAIVCEGVTMHHASISFRNDWFVV